MFIFSGMPFFLNRSSNSPILLFCFFVLLTLFGFQRLRSHVRRMPVNVVGTHAVPAGVLAVAGGEAGGHRRECIDDGISCIHLAMILFDSSPILIQYIPLDSSGKFNFIPSNTTVFFANTFCPTELKISTLPASAN